MKITENPKKPAHHDHCCAQDEPQHTHNHSDDHDHSHDHGDSGGSLLRAHWMLWVSLLVLLISLLSDYIFHLPVNRNIEIVLLLAAYLLAGHKTIQTAARRVLRGDFFNEFTLMTIATLGAFYIGEFSEGLAVMIFYELGELFQGMAVSRSKRSIKALLDIRPDQVTVIRNGKMTDISPSEVSIGETILVKAGEKVALDGILLTASATFNTAALTGESRPDDKAAGDRVLAGMISMSKSVEIEVAALFRDSKLSRILEMVQDATSRKAPTQLLISRLAKIYTPIVFGLAVLIILVPALFMAQYDFNEWLYRGMVFLVIACPCALTISIPLGYFGGIGLASRNGILVKGANFLDVMTRIDTVVSDKTGTLTKGVFNVQQMETDLDKHAFIMQVASLESHSTHPVARAVVSFAGNLPLERPQDVHEIAGHGLTGRVGTSEIIAGNLTLLDKNAIQYPIQLAEIPETIIAVAIDGRYAGYLTIADELKDDAQATVTALKEMGIETVMLSGDKEAVVRKTAAQLGNIRSFGALLPEGKVQIVEQLKKEGKHIAFVGDGVNDAPVIALADAGIAMGALGSDAAIETADIVIQNDQPSRIVSAIRAGRVTRQIVYQNIALALSVKVAVMLLGAGGVATLWEAVFADVGVALLAILNALRIQGKQI